MAAMGAIKAPSTTSVAGLRLPSRASVSWMMRVAAPRPSAASLNSRSAASTWVSSSLRPSLLSTRNTLLDAPAQPVQPHHVGRRRGAVHGQGGIEPPVQRLGALGQRDLHGLDNVEGETFRILALGAVARPGQRHWPRAEPQLGLARLLARLGHDRHLQLAVRLERGVEHAFPRGQGPVLRDPRDQLDIVGPARERRIDVGLPIADHDHLARRPETRRRRPRPIQPAPRLLVLETTLATVRLGAAITGPDRAIHKPQNRFVLGIHRHHGMDEKAQRLAVARPAQTVPPPVPAPRS